MKFKRRISKFNKRLMNSQRMHKTKKSYRNPKRRPLCNQTPNSNTLTITVLQKELLIRLAQWAVITNNKSILTLEAQHKWIHHTGQTKKSIMNVLTTCKTEFIPNRQCLVAFTKRPKWGKTRINLNLIIFQLNNFATLQEFNVLARSRMLCTETTSRSKLFKVKKKSTLST